MADYRELLRRAVEALPDNTGANRRAVYEKARSALVAQLRAIEPPLPAREITTHRLNLEDCIREVEHEATEKLLGRFRDIEAQPVAVHQPEPEPEPQALEDEAAVESEFAAEPPEPEIAAEPQEPEAEEYSAPETEEPYPYEEERATYPAEDDSGEDVPQTPFEEDEASDAEGLDVPYEPVLEPEPESDEVAQSAPSVTPELEDWQPEDEPLGGEPITSADDWDRSEPVADIGAEEIAEDAGAPALETDEPIAPGESVPLDLPAEADESRSAATSIEDIIALAQASATPAAASFAINSEPSGEPVPSEEDDKIIPFAGRAERSDVEHHFISSPRETAPRTDVPLVDLYGRPLRGGAEAAPALPVGEAMSRVSEVDVEPQPDADPAVDDAQVAIDRAIAALDREARGDVPSEAEGTADPAGNGDAAGEEVSESGGGHKSRFGAMTIFAIIAVLLLGGGGALGYWAWREGFVNLDTVFAQAQPQPETQVAQTDADPAAGETDLAAGEQLSADPIAPVPAPNASGVNGTTMPGEEIPFTETTTTPAAPSEPEVSFEDRLPAEAQPADPAQAAAEGEAPVDVAAAGTLALLLEEQPSGAAGAVPYSGNVEWSRGTDELGHPTIVASAAIPARNLDVEVLLRRNADTNLPASHLMEVSFTVAESFVGGSIANLPGVLLKDQELVQGQPLTGASARIVGNSFLFALSSASERDVENNIELLSERDWLDLAMVYGTGRRAIMTLEKGEDGSAIFDEVLAEWAELDAQAAAAQ